MQLSASHKKFMIVLLSSFVLLRIVSLGLYPLFDSTESRYAEMGRKMYETSDYITPFHRDGKPFWGKPPMSFWLTAISLKVFGVNEFGARISSLLCMLIVLLLTFYFSNRQRGPDAALTTSMILISTGLFYVVTGGVMTDPALVVGTTLSMISFYIAMKNNNKLFGYLFFVGIGISLLAKGPVGFVLTAMPCGLWVIMKSRWRDFFKNLPWLTGIVLGLLISAPWYYLAEKKTPGFLEYFFIGEHYKRFVVSGWKGDLYGNAHSKTKGTIWVYLAQSTIPWVFLLFRNIFFKKHRSETFKKSFIFDDWILFLILWTVSSSIFFTMASNVIQPYVLPSLPAFALLMFELIHIGSKEIKTKLIIICSCIIPIIFILAITIPSIKNQKDTQYHLVEHYKKIADPNSQLIYFYQRPYSADFYTHGKAILEFTPDKVKNHFNATPKNYFVIKESQYNQFKEFAVNNFKIIKKFRYYFLLEEK
jgi:4-amino-4-deoxy-L-arabinose transferase-like glycosyltransferase